MRSLKIICAVLTLCGFMAAAGNAARAAGAIAIGKCTRSGYSFDYPSQGAAERRALSECRANGDGTCNVVVTIHRACGAFAVSGACGARGWGYAPTRGRAETIALNSCRKYGGNDCRVRTWVCDSGP